MKKLEDQWEKFKKSEEQLNGVLNIKQIRARFADFRQKMEIWKERLAGRQRFKKQY